MRPRSVGSHLRPPSSRPLNLEHDERRRIASYNVGVAYSTKPVDTLQGNLPLLGEGATGDSVLWGTVLAEDAEKAAPLAVFSDRTVANRVRDDLNSIPRLTAERDALDSENLRLREQFQNAQAQPAPPPTPQRQPLDAVRDGVMKALKEILNEMKADNPVRAYVEAMLNRPG